MNKLTLNHTIYPIKQDSCLNCNKYKKASASLHLDSLNRERTVAVREFFELARDGEHKAWARIYDVFNLYAFNEMENYIYPQALVDAGLSHYDLNVYGINSKIAFRCLSKGAILGDEYAQGWLGLEYRSSSYIQQNDTASIKWLRTAALNGCVASQFNLSITLLKKYQISEVRDEVSDLYEAITLYIKTNPNTAARIRTEGMRDIASYIY